MANIARYDASLPGAQPPKRELDPLHSLRVHWKLALLVFLVAAAAGGYLTWKRDRVLYSSDATVSVSRNFPRILQADRELELQSTREYDSFRNDQVALFMRPDVVLDALERCGQTTYPWRTPDEDMTVAVSRFVNSLQIWAVPQSTRIELTLWSGDPEVPRPALDALLAAFLDAHRREYFMAEDERPEVLRSELDEVQKRIEKKREQILELSQELKVPDFTRAVTSPWSAPLEAARVALAEARRAARSEELELEELSARQAENELDPDQLFGAGTDWESLAPGLAGVIGPLAARHGELNVRLAALGPEHPGREALAREIEQIEKRVRDLLQQQRESELREAEFDLRQARAQIEQLTAEVEELEKKNTTFMAGVQRGRILEEELPRDLQRRDRLEQRLEFFEIEMQSPSYVRIAQPASKVDPRGESNLMRNLALALFGAFVLGLVAPVVRDAADNRVHSILDVQRALGYAPIIWIPDTRKKRYRGLARDQTRRFALAMDRDKARTGARVFCFSGVKHSEADREFVRRAAGLLVELGHRALVVNAAPGAEEEAGAGSGFVGVAAGDELEATPHPGGWHEIPYGRLTRDDRPVPLNADWGEHLRDATRDYDFVLVQAPPILSSSEAENLLAAADVAVLVVEAETRTLGEVRRAGDILASVAPATVSAVLNRVRMYRGRGYYRELARERA